MMLRAKSGGRKRWKLKQRKKVREKEGLGGGGNKSDKK